MSEYWISQQKHWCQYCRIYIADNKPSRTMHEQGKKHKENHEKFLRDIYRKEHENRKEAAKTKRELDRIEKAAMKQYKRDIALETPGATSYIKPPTNSTVSTVNDYGYHGINYTESASSYHTSTTSLPDQSIITPISASTVEDRGDGTEPIIGEWRPVTPPPLPITYNDSSIKKEFKDDSTLDSKTQYASTNQIDDDEDEEDPDDLRNFKIVEKSFPIDNYEELDQEVIKIKKEEGVDEKSSVVFKKRKFGDGSNKSRNIRKKN